jgi:hypothetical protein
VRALRSSSAQSGEKSKFLGIDLFEDKKIPFREIFAGSGLSVIPSIVIIAAG